MRAENISGCGKFPSGSPAGPGSAAHYLTLPSLNSAQQMISEQGDIRIPCRLLAGLNGFYPQNDLRREGNDPAKLVPAAFRLWLENVIPERVRRKIDFSVRILPGGEMDSDQFDDIPEDDIVILVSIDDFINRWFPLQERIAAYEAQFPGFGKFLLHILSFCPLNIGTPENMYEMASYFCWHDEENEQSVFNERLEEFITDGESEDDARDLAAKSIMVSYDEFSESLPAWTFQRRTRRITYRKAVPEELQALIRSYRDFRRLRRHRYLFPPTNFPSIFASWDRPSHDLFCDVLNRIANEQMPYGYDYYFSGLAWHFPPADSRNTNRVFREIRIVLEYFARCIDFLLDNEMEYPND